MRSAGERRLVRVTFEEIRRLSEHCDEVDARIEAAIERQREYATTRKTVGAVTTAVIVAKLGRVTRYASAHALEKAIGLNLKERSSGVRQNMEVHITRRGPGMARKYLSMTAMRLVATDAVVRAWYQRRASFRAGNKSSALVAVMRKQAAGAVARGEGRGLRGEEAVRRASPGRGAHRTPAPPPGRGRDDRVVVGGRCLGDGAGRA